MEARRSISGAFYIINSWRNVCSSVLKSSYLYGIEVVVTFVSVKLVSGDQVSGNRLKQLQNEPALKTSSLSRPALPPCLEHVPTLLSLPPFTAMTRMSLKDTLGSRDSRCLWCHGHAGSPVAAREGLSCPAFSDQTTIPRKLGGKETLTKNTSWLSQQPNSLLVGDCLFSKCASSSLKNVYQRISGLGYN